MAGQILRDYQERGLSEILAAFAGGARSVLAVSPTGSGKTTLFGEMLRRMTDRALIAVHRRELADQASRRLREFGVPFGFIMAGEPTTPGARVQIASVQTLVRREAPPASIVVADEAHLSTAATWQKVLEGYPDARILGVTATPWRLSGRSLASQYDALVVVERPHVLREQGHLSPYAGFSFTAPDLAGVGTVGDDYNQGKAAVAASAIVPTVVRDWLAHASHLSTVVFACTVEHSLKLTAEFKDAGVTAEHLDGSTPLETRKAILRRVDAGVTRVLCNVGVAVEGLDIPRLKCCVLARPTMSLSRALQMMGRVRRPWNGVTARIHDHAFVIQQHGMPDAERDYTLAGRAEAPPSISTCPGCKAYDSGNPCSFCGHTWQLDPREERQLQEIHDAQMFEFASGGITVAEALPAPKGGVSISWTTPRTIEGVYLSSEKEKTQWGERRVYKIEGDKKFYTFPGTYQLDQLMARVRPGVKVRVTYVGETMNAASTKTFKEFTVAKDEEPEPVDPRWAELETFMAEHNRMPNENEMRLYHFCIGRKRAGEAGIFETLMEIYNVDNRNYQAWFAGQLEKLRVFYVANDRAPSSIGDERDLYNFERRARKKNPKLLLQVVGKRRTASLKPHTRACGVCRSPFQSKYPTAKFCGVKCRNKYHQERSL